jgi:hypothetical protein
MKMTFGKNSVRLVSGLVLMTVLGACAEAPQVDRRSASTAVDCRNEYRKARIAAERSSSESFSGGTGSASSSELSRSVGSMMGYMQSEGREGRRLVACYDAVGAAPHERRPVADLSIETQSSGYAGNRPGSGGGAGFSNY